MLDLLQMGCWLCLCGCHTLELPFLCLSLAQASYRLSEFISLDAFISWLTEWALVLMPVLLHFFVCPADRYMTFPFFLKHFLLPPQSLPAELLELLLHQPWSSATTPRHSHVVQKMARLVQEWGVRGLATVRC